MEIKYTNALTIKIVEKSFFYDLLKLKELFTIFVVQIHAN